MPRFQKKTRRTYPHDERILRIFEVVWYVVGMEKMTKIDAIIECLPSDSGVYVFQDTKGAPLYIGKATCIKKRVRTHFYESAASNPQKGVLLRDTANIAAYSTASAIEALVLESRLIKKLKPRYNILLRDYFYVGFTKDIFPKIFLTHQFKTENLKLKTSFVGPFTDGRAVKQTLKLLRSIFPYCTCKTPHKRACLNYHMGRDPGYCCFPKNDYKQSIASKKQKEYKKTIAHIERILKGHAPRVLHALERDMKTAAKKQEFEKAALLRNQWEGMQNVLAHKTVLTEPSLVADNTPAKDPRLTRVPSFVVRITKEAKRIEGYDISNIQGSWAVGSMVVFSQDKTGALHPQKSDYRKFRVKTVREANDPAMMREMLQRRLLHQEWPFPDLIVVDGGKTQRNAALQAFNALQKTTPIFGLAKREEELYTEKGVARLSSLPSSYELFFRHLRDEAHRFAIGYYRKLHRKNITKKVESKRLKVKS